MKQHEKLFLWVFIIAVVYTLGHQLPLKQWQIGELNALKVFKLVLGFLFVFGTFWIYRHRKK